MFEGSLSLGCGKGTAELCTSSYGPLFSAEGRIQLSDGSEEALDAVQRTLKAPRGFFFP